jgi:hypothetical protein
VNRASDLVGGEEGGDGGGSDIAFWNADQAVTGAAGQIILNLTYEPIDGSLHIRWNGIDQPPTEWTLDGQLVTLTSSLIRVGDLLTAAYAYDLGVMADPTDILVPFEASGWKWLQVSRTDTVDYSSPSFDDSGWATAPAAFGETTTTGHYDPWPRPTTVWNVNSKMWVRRNITSEAGHDITIEPRWDRYLRVYWNGVDLFGSLNVTVSGTSPRTIPGASVTGSDHLAISCTDDGWTGLGTGNSYFDVELTQVVAS